jgi:hypothetical protein
MKVRAIKIWLFVFGIVAAILTASTMQVHKVVWNLLHPN